MAVSDKIFNAMFKSAVESQLHWYVFAPLFFFSIPTPLPTNISRSPLMTTQREALYYCARVHTKEYLLYL